MVELRDYNPAGTGDDPIHDPARTLAKQSSWLPSHGLRTVVKKRVFKILSQAGIALTMIGSVGLLLGFSGVIDFDDYAFGLSAGVRMLGSIAIAGCLLSAIGCFGLEGDPGE